MCTKTVDLSTFVLPALLPLVFSFSLPSQDYDAVSSEKHKNSCQVLVPQELPVPDIQGRIFYFKKISRPLIIDVEIFSDGCSFFLCLSVMWASNRRSEKSRWNMQLGKDSHCGGKSPDEWERLLCFSRPIHHYQRCFYDCFHSGF